MQQVVMLAGSRMIVSSFVDGIRVVTLKPRETEVDALAHALWLQNHGHAELADQYLEEYLQRTSGIIRH